MTVTGARVLADALVRSGVTLCLANPGTSELDLVAALETTPGLRTVLCLHETVATGAADGYARVTGRPAATALHQGPGLANGLANLHNARKARTPIVNLVGVSGESYLDGPLDSEPDVLAQPVSKWLRTAGEASVAHDVRLAVAAATAAPRGVATLLLPESVMGSRCAAAHPDDAPGGRGGEDGRVGESVEAARRALARGSSTAMVVGATVLDEKALHAATRLAYATGAGLFVTAFPTVLARGAGQPRIVALSRDPATARGQLGNAQALVLVDTDAPVAAFEVPGQSRRLVPHGVTAIHLHTAPGAAAELFDELSRGLEPGSSTIDNAPEDVAVPNDQPLTGASIGLVLGACLPGGSILVDESNALSPTLMSATESAAPHVLLTVPGFAIGGALPLSVGAALGAADRQIVCTVADGSAMFSLPALWTQAREGLRCLTIVLSNRRYQILLDQVGRRYAEDSADHRALAGSPLFDLTRPALDFVSLAQGMGVPAGRARTVAELQLQIRTGLTASGPYLVEAALNV